MARFFVVALVVFAAIIINPTLRAKAMPYIQPALDPAYEWIAGSRVRDITKQLESRVEAGRPLPTKETLGAFLKEHYASADNVVDPWGIPYFLKATRGSVRVGSAGPDRQPGTPDDILAEPVATTRR